VGHAAVVLACRFASGLEALEATVSASHAIMLLRATSLLCAAAFLFTFALRFSLVVLVRPAPAATLLIGWVRIWCRRTGLRNMAGFRVPDGRAIDERRLSFVDATVSVTDTAAHGAGGRAVIAGRTSRSLRVRRQREDRNDQRGADDSG